MIAFVLSFLTACIIIAAVLILVTGLRNTVVSFARRGPWHGVIAIVGAVFVALMVSSVALLPSALSSASTEISELPQTTIDTDGLTLPGVPAGG